MSTFKIMRKSDAKTYLVEQLQIMCNRCTNHEMCQGTGCNPKIELTELINTYCEEAPANGD